MMLTGIVLFLLGWEGGVGSAHGREIGVKVTAGGVEDD